MAHPAVLQRTEEIAAFIEREGGAASFDSRGIATNARASAVAGLFAAKVLGRADDVPLEDLVTPQSLAGFEQLLSDEARIAVVRGALRGMGLVWPRVQPQADGTIVVPLAPTHPETSDDSAAITTPRQRPAVGVRLRLVDGTDDWRVEWSR